MDNFHPRSSIATKQAQGNAPNLTCWSIERVTYDDGQSTQGGSMDFLVTKFGVIGNRLAMDTAASQAAVDRTHSQCGGRVLLPSLRRPREGSMALMESAELIIEVDSRVTCDQASGLDYIALIPQQKKENQNASNLNEGLRE
jgi:hypothetical protein